MCIYNSSIIDKELELLYRQMEYPKLFINIEPEWKSSICVNPEEVKLIDIMELACGFFYLTDGIQRIDNKELHLTDITRLFEKMFNINLGDIYKKEKFVDYRKIFILPIHSVTVLKKLN